MRKKIPKRYRYTKQATKRDEKRTEPAEPQIDTSGPLWGYSPTGRIIVDDPMMTQTPKRAFEQTASTNSLSNFLDPSHVTPGGRVIIDKLPQIYLCPICGGTGKRKAMQLAMTSHGTVIRSSDKEVVCGLCKGSGKIK